MPVVPTLELMAEVYRLDRTGGAESEESDMGTFIAWLLGDEVAAAAGYSGLGLGPEDGPAFCVQEFAGSG